MHGLKSIHGKIIKTAGTSFENELNGQGDFKFHPNSPKMSDKQVIALSLCPESSGIDPENCFLSKIKTDCPGCFPSSHITRCNKRRKTLAGKANLPAQGIGNEMTFGEDFFIVGPVPVPVCKTSREGRTKACKENHGTACDKGRSAVNKQYHIGHKSHSATPLNDTYKQMDITKASVHDIGHLDDVKHGTMRNRALLADKGCSSKPVQIDLLEPVQIKIETPMRANQKIFKPCPFVLKKCRKRIETISPRLCGQFMLKGNYAKSFVGSATRVIDKIAGLTILQYINKINNKPIDNIKHSLAF